MAEIKSSTIKGLTVTGKTAFSDMPTLNGQPLMITADITDFIKVGPYYRFVEPLTYHALMLSQNPLSFSPQAIDPSIEYVPREFLGKVAFLDVTIDIQPGTGTTSDISHIWITRRRGEAHTGNGGWSYRGMLHQGTDRWFDEYRIATDDRGRFDIWSYNADSWQPRIIRMYVKGIGLKI